MLSNFRKHFKYSSILNIVSGVASSKCNQIHFSMEYPFSIKKKSSKIWMNEHINDIYVKKAKMVKLLYF